MIPQTTIDIILDLENVLTAMRLESDADTWEPRIAQIEAIIAEIFAEPALGWEKVDTASDQEAAE